MAEHAPLNKSIKLGLLFCVLSGSVVRPPMALAGPSLPICYAQDWSSAGLPGVPITNFPGWMVVPGSPDVPTALAPMGFPGPMVELNGGDEVRYDASAYSRPMSAVVELLTPSGGMLMDTEVRLWNGPVVAGPPAYYAFRISEVAGSPATETLTVSKVGGAALAPVVVTGLAAPVCGGPFCATSHIEVDASPTQLQVYWDGVLVATVADAEFQHLNLGVYSFAGTTLLKTVSLASLDCATPTSTSTGTATPTDSATATVTVTPTSTFTASPTATPTATATASTTTTPVAGCYSNDWSSGVTSGPVNQFAGWNTTAISNGIPFAVNAGGFPGPFIEMSAAQEIRYDAQAFSRPLQSVVHLLQPSGIGIMDMEVRLWDASLSGYYIVRVQEFAPSPYTVTITLAKQGGTAMAPVVVPGLPALPCVGFGCVYAALQLDLSTG